MKANIDEILLHSRFIKQKGYWLKKLTPGMTVTELIPNGNHHRFSLHAAGKEKVDILIDNNCCRQLLKFTKQSELSIYIVLLTVLKIVIYRYTGTRDITVISPLYRPNISEMTLNRNLFLRDEVSPDIPFIRLLLKVRQSVLEAWENQDYPSAKLLEYLYHTAGEVNPDGQWEISRVCCLLKNIHEEDPGQNPGNKLVFSFSRENHRVRGHILFHPSIYERSYVEKIPAYFSRLLAQALEDIRQEVSRIHLLSKREREQFLFALNDTHSVYPSEKPVYRWIEEQVDQAPDHIALIGQIPNSKSQIPKGVAAPAYKEETRGLASLYVHVTYQKLNERSNQLARGLRSAGVTEGSIAAIMAEPSIDMLVGILALLKAGAAYLPLDPEYPPQRIQYILKDSHALWLLKPQYMADDLRQATPQRPAQTIFIDDEAVYADNPTNLDLETTPTDVVYLMYTSGSTGNPKGVVVEHRSLVNYVFWACSTYLTEEIHNFPLYSSLAFDLTVTSIYVPLVSGNTIFTYKNTGEGPVVSEVFRDDRVEIVKLTPTHLQLIKNLELNHSRVQRLIVGGEDLTTALAAEIHKKFLQLGNKIEIFNEYGPTETVVGCMIYRYDFENDTRSSVPIGIPADNLQIYILDPLQEPVPVGGSGEIHISGSGVSSGYLNQPRLTAERFVDNPFLPGLRMYRSGDLARQLPDGNIEFLGRIDQQVKIRGYRIEPIEIETQLATHEAVKEAMAIPWTEPDGEINLCAYIVPVSAAAKIHATGLREYLAERLPSYMIPVYFVRLRAIPLTPNGKIDRDALPAPSLEKEEHIVPPRNPVEEALVEIWSKVLRVEKELIGIDSDFFKLGGHSLKATILLSGIHKRLNVKIPLAALFKASTIRGLSRFLVTAVEDKFTPIKAAEKKEYYVLSSAQKRLFILHQLDRASTGYNIPVVYSLEGQVDRKRFEKTLKILIRRHESFRTSFEMRGDEPVQKIQKTAVFGIEYFESGEKEARNIISRFIRPFNLKYPPLLRAGLIRIRKSPHNHILMVDMHHIVSDGVSMTILVKEFMTLYGGEKCPELRLQYKDYSEWQQVDKQVAARKQQQAYWLKEFAGEIPVLNLPLDFKRPSIQSFEGKHFIFRISRENSESLKKLALKEEATMHMVLLALLNILFSTLSGQEDIVIGTGTAGRSSPDLQPIIGMFVNTLALRNYPTGQKTFNRFLSEVKKRTLEAYENQDYPFEELVEKVRINKDPARSPLFDVMFLLQNMDVSTNKTLHMKVSPVEFESHISKFDMSFDGWESDGQLFFAVEYCTRLFKEETIVGFTHYFEKIVNEVLTNPGVKLWNIEMISEEERHWLVYDFNRTAAGYPKFKTIDALFEEQVQCTPEGIAVSGIWQGAEATGNGGLEPRRGLDIKTTKLQLTYKELDRQSNHLASILREIGVMADSIVGLMVERSVEMLLGVLGILKAGGAYLPVGLEYPEERKRYMIKDGNVKVLITPGTVTSDDGLFLINLLDSANHASKAAGPVTRQHAFNNLAYTIYTSGSTGKPKGVMIQHGSVVNRLNWMQRAYPLDASDVILQKTPYTFDVSVWEIFWWAITGAKVCLMIPGGEKDPGIIVNTIANNNVTVMHFVPSMLSAFLNYLYENPDRAVIIKKISSLKQVFASGEALTISQLERFNEIIYKENSTKLANLYGPTEAAIDVSYFDCFPSASEIRENIPIGKPIDNINLFVVNKGLGLLPGGVPGELVISGVGLARGYLNRPGLTAEKFCLRRPGGRFLKKLPPWTPRKNFLLKGSDKNHIQLCNHASMQYHSFPPYYPITPFPHSPIYLTGDLARWLSHGNIEFLGRIDHQVKIRGFRIELEEIEAQLLMHEKVKETVVIALPGDGNDKYLCAYITAETDVSAAELREYLSGILPVHMVPPYFVQLEKIPLNPNGKIDKNALPDPDVTVKPGEYEPPHSQIEKKLVEIWSEILAIEKKKIGIMSNFFELGGHSLKGIMLISDIHKGFDVKMSLAQVFRAPVLRDLARYIETAKQDKYASIQPVEKKSCYPLSSAQKRMYLLQQMELENINYNISRVVVLAGELDRKVFAGTFHRLIKRHESLRTSFHMIENEPLQKIHDEVGFDIEFYQANENEVEELVKRYIKAFDLGKAPLFRVGLVDVANDEEKHILMVEMHHIISDGVSDSILIREFMALYGKEKLAPLRLQYKDYSEWQNRLVRQGEIKQQENYWLKVFAGEIPVLNIPTDYPRPESQSFQGEALKVEIGSAETGAMHHLVLKQEATLFILLLALLNILLAKISCNEDIVVGTPIMGRRHSDLKEIIGMFVNTLALRNRPESHKTFKTFLRELRESTLMAYENQEYPFEYLVEKVVVNRDASRNPLFDTILVLQNMDQQKIRIPGLQLMAYNFKNNITKFDLSLSCHEAGERLFLTFGYCTKLFKKQTIERFSNYFKKIVSMILNQPDIRLGEIEIISEEEKKQLLYDFNDTAAGYPEDKTIRKLFEEQVERTPGHIAVVGPSERKYKGYMTYISYRELNRKSLHLASLLKQKGIEADTIVSVMLERSLEMITCLLGILKAGGAYLPIDPDYPGDRIDYMLADSDSKTLVTRQDLSKKLKFEKEIIDLSDTINRVPTPSHLHLPPAPTTSLAYVIYTSGTTGNPKGALIENRNVVRLLFNDEFQFDFDSTDVWTLFHSFCFDFSIWEMYGALLYGGKLIVIPAIVTKDPEQYLEVLKKEKVTVLNQTPAAFHHLDEKDKELKNPGKSLYLKYVIFGGEALTPLKLKGWHNRHPQTKLINMFGITETTVHVTFKEITVDDIKPNKSNIGKPIPTLKTYIMDRNAKLVPLGVPGEIVVGGEGVGRGYLNRVELTGEKFINNPYKKGQRLYLSGDLGKLSANGEMEYLGRIDHQVKIRGFRIEPGEIENHLLRHPKIKDAVVIAREGAKEDRLLCAYIVPHSPPGSNALEVSELREYLALRLADYMIPSYFIKLGKIPLTVNGKVDRKNLPAVDPVIGDNYAAPRNKLEEKLVEIWSEVLQIKKGLIGIDSDFFHLGGHSLKATRLLTKIHKELQVKIPLKEIFTASTVRELARCLEAVAEHKFIPINVIEKKEYYPLSSAQQRLYFMHRLDPGNTGYNVPTVVLLQGNTKKEKLENNFNRLINRHENLRTSFEMVDSEAVQRIREEADLKIEYHEASEEEAKKIVKGFIKPFDLSKKLLRAGLITIGKGRHVFMVDMPHIIADAASLNIIIKELTTLDRGDETLPPLKIHYKDYSEWQNKWLQAGGEKIQEEYWLKQFPGEIPLLTLPTDYARPEMQSYEGSNITFTLNKQETRDINTLARENQSTLFMVLLALFSILLSKISSGEDTVIGTTVEGRRHEDLHQVIGIFVNILALRQYPKKEKTFVQFLNEVKENTLAAFENQEYPFDKLVEKLVTNRDTSRNPLFDVMFQYQSNEEKQEKTNVLKVKPFEYGVKKSKLDLTLWGAEAGEKLFFTFEYSTTLFNKSTIQYFIDYFKEIARYVLEDPERMLADIEIVPEAKKQEILAKYGSRMEDE